MENGITTKWKTELQTEWKMESQMEWLNFVEKLYFAIVDLF